MLLVNRSLEMICGSSTSNLLRQICEFLDLIFGQDAKYNDTVQTLFKTFMGLLEGLGVDKSTINLCPASTSRDAVFGGL